MRSFNWHRSIKAGIARASACMILAASGCGDAGTASSDGPGTIDQTTQELRGRQPCGGPRHRACPDGAYCRARVEGRCLDDNDFGVCAPRPEVCTKEFKPVCGCDGKTYGNACTAAAAGVSVDHQGECAPPNPGFCGGIAGFPCPAGQECVDDPSDDCDPNNGGADCAGICKAPFCGGIAGFPCPEGLQCIDDPSDDCDPNKGGADCGGICVPPKGDPCGKTVCGPGTTCCNASCGICTPPGRVCIQIACQ